MPLPSGTSARRALWVGAAYVGLLLLGEVDFKVADVHIGALAVLPLLIIAAFIGRRFAIPTAVLAAIVFSIFDHRAFSDGRVLRVSIPLDAVTLALSYIVIIELVERMNAIAQQKNAVESDLRAAQLKAERDPLTGLPNRAVFLNRLHFLTGHTTARFAVLFGDLDRFKDVNDSHGHEVGDRILQLAGQRIAHALRANDFVCRIGGDEFAVLLYGVHDEREVETIVKKIESSFSDPFVDAEQTISIGITLGASHFPEDSKHAETLLRIADERMYARKPGRRQTSGIIPATPKKQRLPQ
jgi:diguanylate cyclase (GGDEF)-like protein